MSDIIQIPNQRQGKPLGKAYELMLNSIGTEEFGSTVRECLMSVAGGIRRVYLFEATGPDTSTLQYFSCEPRLIELLPAYSQSYIRMDPVRDAYSAAPAAGDMALLRIRPCDIPTPGFRRRFFEDCGIVERLSIIQRGHEAWRVINIARHASNGCFSNVEIDALVELASLARHDESRVRVVPNDRMASPADRSACGPVQGEIRARRVVVSAPADHDKTPRGRIVCDAFDESRN